ncbi:hypothetical protein GFD24_08700 [Bifidobacterium ramosum]|uniref:Uncharacterized protein n=1 Tax=Bifidobacterium ramosum TaxID=1798158 RepID=A0A7K3TD31_9BIFI|nr:hypothetical protein [Bifidobacterium ramosum]
MATAIASRYEYDIGNGDTKPTQISVVTSHAPASGASANTGSDANASNGISRYDTWKFAVGQRRIVSVTTQQATVAHAMVRVRRGGVNCGVNRGVDDG